MQLKNKIYTKNLKRFVWIPGSHNARLKCVPLLLLIFYNIYFPVCVCVWVLLLECFYDNADDTCSGTLYVAFLVRLLKK